MNTEHLIQKGSANIGAELSLSSLLYWRSSIPRNVDSVHRKNHLILATYMLET